MKEEITENKSGFNVDLVSPERKLVSARVWQVVLPGEEGVIGVRAGHSSLVTSLRAGGVRIFSDNDSEKPDMEYFITGGFADITADNCTILAEQATDFGELDEKSVAQEVKNLSEDVELAKDEEEKSRVLRELELAKAKLVAITGSYSSLG